MAEHCTCVGPSGKNDPDWRVQLMAMGARPPVVDGFGNATATAALPIVEAVNEGGQAIVKPDGGSDPVGGVGLVGEPPHPVAKSTITTSHATSGRSTAARMDTAIVSILQCVIWL